MKPATSLMRRCLLLAATISFCAPLPATCQERAAPPPNPGRFVSSSEEKINVKVVEDFLGAWNKKDLNKALSLLADEVSFRVSQTRPPVVGKEKVSETFKNDFARFNFNLKTLKTTVLGPVVITKRVDIITPASGGADLKVNIAGGMFFVNDGKITEWTDYQLK